MSNLTVNVFHFFVIFITLITTSDNLTSQSNPDSCWFVTSPVPQTGIALPSVAFSGPEDTSLYNFLMTTIPDNLHILMFGEQHWMSSISSFKINIVKRLISERNFRNLVIEYPYSYTGYLNQYLNLPTGEGEEILSKISTAFDSAEEIHFLKSLQSWNYHHPDRKIVLLCSDFEQDFTFPFLQVILPFFTDFGDRSIYDYIKIKQNVDDTLFNKMDSILMIVPESFHCSNRAFIDKQYIENTIINIRSAFAGQQIIRLKGEEAGFQDFMNIRIKRIIANLGDKKIFGDRIDLEKTIFWGGSRHMNFIPEDPRENDFSNEGSYLRKKYNGKTCSINVSVLGYRIPDSYYEKPFTTHLSSYQGLVQSYQTCNPDNRPGQFLLIEPLNPVTTGLLNQMKDLDKKCLFLEGSANKIFRQGGQDIYADYLQFDYHLIFAEATLYTLPN